MIGHRYKVQANRTSRLARCLDGVAKFFDIVGIARVIVQIAVNPGRIVRQWPTCFGQLDFQPPFYRLKRFLGVFRVKEGLNAYPVAWLRLAETGNRDRLRLKDLHHL